MRIRFTPPGEGKQRLARHSASPIRGPVIPEMRRRPYCAIQGYDALFAAWIVFFGDTLAGFLVAAIWQDPANLLEHHVDVPPLDSIVEDFRAGERSKLILASRAIARFEKIGDPLESDLMRCSDIEL